MKRDLSLYIHVPFCEKKCDYCDFLSGPADKAIQSKYVDALVNEIKSYKQFAEEYLINTIFIGGGTPSFLVAEHINNILDAVYKNFSLKASPENIEITLEVNPGTVNYDKFVQYKKSGINRLSIGLQSTDNEELKLLGRIHTYEEFLENYKAAREAGFQNINLDLISALPGQSLKSWKNTLERAAALKPEHISAYSLILEEGTPFYRRYREEDQDEELDRVIYKETKSFLEEQGYIRYEVSNYAKPGYEAKHNLVYWTRGEYLGLGLGSASLIKEERFTKETVLTDYIEIFKNGSLPIERLKKEKEQLTVKKQMEEFMFLGLRLCNGIDKADFFRDFGKTVDEIYGDILKKSEEEGLIVSKRERIYLTEKGTDLSNLVMSRFLFD
ncbi:coproporphyrinogen III oxidase [Anaerocolumna cellulosilytica]|uniref:Heme chaperone HemW n=1 Tax=Anaerocolumna cellulosilytica TaxID=433286 RepID=A0A6S6R670_9FIRM|nr:radical SAM family heme chaperone HemW [Anaerocolumna cellulosilytica]MBB5193832.1 oxygen-independent coproporphyrinogen-3 oxidase [Anaerocolumna cellulosilytica]BCJ94952.1 coproporphyrinogen III oxidase [Anaerocolumna cellulosilytica]